MKTTTCLLVMPLAIPIFILLMRGQRAPRRLLRSPALLSAVRLVAIVAAMMGIGDETSAQEGANPPASPANAQEDQAPDQARVDLWHQNLRDGRLARFRRRIIEAYTLPAPTNQDEARVEIESWRLLLPETLARLLAADLRRHWYQEKATVMTVPELLFALRELEEAGLWFSAFDTILFHLRDRVALDSGTLEQGLELQRELVKHRRISEAFVLAMARSGPIHLDPRAWASKAATRRPILSAEARAREALRRELIEILKQAPSPAEETEAATSFQAETEGIRISHAGGPLRELPPGATFAFGRDDLLQLPEGTALRHPWLGRMEFAKAGLVDIVSLPEHLDRQQRDLIMATLEKARSGDLVALGLIELSLPLTHRALAGANSGGADGPGREALRMIERVYDDFVIREVKDFRREHPSLPEGEADEKER